MTIVESMTAKEARAMAMEYGNIDDILHDIAKEARNGKLNKKFLHIADNDVVKLKKLGYKVECVNHTSSYDVSW